ncbi:MAG: hypothetical protein AB1552_14090 [Nitrospirota bacterium]
MYHGIPYYELLKKVRSDVNEETATFFSDEEIQRWLNESMLIIADHAGYPLKKLQLNLVDGTESYRADEEFYAVEHAYYVKSSSEKIPLTLIDLMMDDEITGQDKTTEGDPAHYFLRGNTIYLRPVPDANRTNGLEIWAKCYPARMFRNYSTGTVSVVNGDQTVTGAGTSWSSFLNAYQGAVFGIGTDPTIWYEIGSIANDTSLELLDTYPGPSASAQSYIISDVPDILPAMHSYLIDYAVARCFGKERTTIGLSQARMKAFEYGVPKSRIAQLRKDGEDRIHRIRDRDSYPSRRHDKFGNL